MMKRISSLFLGLGLALVLASCGVNDALDNANKYLPQMSDLKGNTNQTNQYLKYMSDGVHNQTLKLTLEMALSPECRKYYPLPTDCMPGAQKFAGEASPEELVELTKLWLWRVDLWKADEVSEQVGKAPQYKGKYQFQVQKIDDQITQLKSGPDHGTSEENAQKIAALTKQKEDLRSTLSDRFKEYNTDKRITLLVLGAIAGLAPQSTIEQLYQEQLAFGRGAYRSATKALLAARASYINQYLLAADYRMPGHIDNTDSLKKAVEFAQQLEFIVSLPELADLQLKTTGIFPEDPAKPKLVKKADITVATLLPASNMQGIWDDLKAAADGLPAYFNAHNYQPGYWNEQLAELPALNAVIAKQDQYWTAKANATP